MLKYKKAGKDTFVDYLMIILKFLYLSTILTPTQGHRKQGVGEQLPCLPRLLLQSIAFSLNRFFYFVSISDYFHFKSIKYH